MARYYMLLNSSSRPGRADEYSDWCRSRHLPELMEVLGVIGIKRFRELMAPEPDGQVRFSTLFELECDHPREVMAEIGRRIGAKEMDTSDAYDPSSVTTLFAELEGAWGSMFVD